MRNALPPSIHVCFWMCIRSSRNPRFARAPRGLAAGSSAAFAAGREEAPRRVRELRRLRSRERGGHWDGAPPAPSGGLAVATARRELAGIPHPRRAPPPGALLVVAAVGRRRRRLCELAAAPALRSLRRRRRRSPQPAGMKIEKKNAGFPTNFEVLDFLRSRGARVDPMGCLGAVAASECKVYEYLLKTPAAHQTRESIDEFIMRCEGFKLTESEKLNVINWRPSSAADAYAMIQECGKRFSKDERGEARDEDERVQELLDLVKDVFPPPPPEPEEVEE